MTCLPSAIAAFKALNLGAADTKTIPNVEGVNITRFDPPTDGSLRHTPAFRQPLHREALD